jgi:hypothetical protein
MTRLTSRAALLLLGGRVGHVPSPRQNGERVKVRGKRKRIKQRKSIWTLLRCGRRSRRLRS